MIRIRSSKPDSKAALICLEVTLNTPRNVYTISSDRALADSASFEHGLFGGIAWPVSRFRIGKRLLPEQQVFLPPDEATVAMSWTLFGNPATAAQFVVRPFFSGCGPRFYRDLGFHVDSNENERRFTWLSRVHGPQVLADTNGRYHEEPVLSFDSLSTSVAAPASKQDLIMPGRFEFEVSWPPSVLIFSTEGPAVFPSDQHIGFFLAGLIKGSAVGRGSSVSGSVGASTQQLAAE